MSKTCARCGKTVYPIEELKCLDKTWHKQCFKCQVCQMTLNMRNYKGFNKEPYCEAHIPKAKATTVAETPEFRRIAENTKIQSNVKYHADFEKAKGKFTQVADDPETLRIKENSKNISNVAYHGELQKKADMERQRNIGDGNNPTGRNVESVSRPAPAPAPAQSYGRGGNVPLTHNSHPPPPVNDNPSPYSARASSNVIYTSDRGPVNVVADRQVGSIHDYDPVNEFYGSHSSDSMANHQQPRYYMPQEYQQQQPQQYQQQQHHHHQQQQHLQQQQRKYSGGYNEVPVNNGREFSDPGLVEPAHSQPRNSGRVYRALYEYKAQDADEVSFIEGDFIINCTAIDEGWLSGIVQRTGKNGMLPANYVTPAI